MPLADPDVPLHVKRNIADILFAVPEETLDPHFSLKIKKMVGEPEKLLGELFQLLLFVAFNEVVISTAFVECLFAQFKQLLLQIPKPPSVSLLAGKHMQSSFKRTCGSKITRHTTGNYG